ncbi:hypothetical protein WJX73_010281, partial [Symbiochloris irregularis]
AGSPLAAARWYKAAGSATSRPSLLGSSRSQGACRRLAMFGQLEDAASTSRALPPWQPRNAVKLSEKLSQPRWRGLQ